MILSVKIETLMWLLPVVFMLHDFEEIIMLRPWLRTNRDKIEKRFPARLLKSMERRKSMSTSAFCVAVMEEMIVISVITFVGVEYKLYDLWAGLLIGFFVHLLVHIGQFIFYRGYVPVIITSIPAAVYSLIAIHDLNTYYPLDITMTVIWAIAFLLFIAGNLAFALMLSVKFDSWLGRHFK
jgi:hypothetical protein